MAKESVKAGTTSHSVNLFIQDSSSTIGAGLSGLVFNSAGLVASYSFTGANAGRVAITLATLAAVNSAFSSGGFKEIDATNMKGGYRLDVPDAALAAAKGQTVTFELHGAANMAPCWFEIELTGTDNQDGVRGGVTALPNAAASASGGLIINGSNAGTVTLAALTCTGSLTISDGLLISRSSSNTSAITATGNGTGHGAVFTSGAGATGDGVQMTAASTNGNGLAATKTGSGLAWKGATTDLTLAKTTNITGFNDIAATAIVSSGAITTSGGAVSTVTAVTGLTAANLDVAISTRLASGSYTAPDNATIALIAGYTDSIESRLPAALVGGRMDSTVGAINNDATSAANLAKTTRAIARGTVTAGASSTSIPTSAFTPAGASADQFKGRIVTFDADTTTAALRGESTDITASSNAATPTLTVTALSAVPVSGDTFSVT